MLRRVHPKKRSVSWVNSVPRQFLPNGSSFIRDSRWSSIGLVSQPASNKEETEVAGGL